MNFETLIHFLFTCSFLEISMSQTKQHGKYIKDAYFEVKDTIGLQMCLNLCQQYSNCKSINYYASSYTCYLNNRNSTDVATNVMDEAGSILVDIESYLNGGSSCSCADGYRCINTKFGTTACILAECIVTQIGVKNEKQISIPAVMIGKTVDYGCKDGYVARGTTQSICQANGQMTSISFVCYRVIDSWILAFRGQSNVGISDYDVYMNTGVRHETNTSVPTECTEFTKSTLCPYHYRTGILDDWSSLNIQQVLFAVYKNGSEVKRIIFNGTSSTYINWFSNARILNSTWNDVTPTTSYNYFSIQGHSATDTARHFFISNVYSGCPGDRGWFTSSLHGFSGNCAWDEQTSMMPTYLVCLKTTVCYMKTETQLADFFAVFIKSSVI